MGEAQGLIKIMYSFKIMVILMVLACSSVYGSEKTAIDSFEYDHGWKPMVESPPVELTLHKTDLGEQALSLRCDFSRKVDRCYWDREVSLDLSRFGRFSLWVYAENPQAVRNGNLYFQSGNGWFSGRLEVGSEGWQKMHLWKSDFQIEGTPQGWGKISKIRLSFWNASNTDTLLAVDDLEASTSEIMVVLDDSTIRKDPQKASAVKTYSNAMTEILKNSRMDFGVVTGTDVESGALSGCKVAILPYNPDISEREYEKIRQFMRSGGKLMMFYLLPDRLADNLLPLRWRSMLLKDCRKRYLRTRGASWFLNSAVQKLKLSANGLTLRARIWKSRLLRCTRTEFSSVMCLWPTIS
jgi:hypothetical protein